MTYIILLMRLLILGILLVLGSFWELPWIKPEDINQGIPPSVSIYTLHTTESPFGTKLTGGYAIFNMNDTNLEFIVRDTNGDALGYYPKTPIDYAAQQENVVYAVLNGGFFDWHKNISASFLAENGKVKCSNQMNNGPDFHPTVAAFGVTFDGKMETEYIYSYGDNHQTYKFASPNNYPGPPPEKQAGDPWYVKQGIGAGPILIKNNKIVSRNVQHFDYPLMINHRHPRSAICTDTLNNLYFVAIDGRQGASDGLYMSEIAEVMKSLNCFNAMNLDGGGSTMLYANDRIINHPSDKEGPRKIISAILIRDKYKKKVKEETK